MGMPRQRGPAAWVGFASLLVLILLGAALYFTMPLWYGWWQLQHTYVLQGTGATSSVAKVGLFGMEPVTSSLGPIAEFAHVGTTGYALILGSDNKSLNVARISDKQSLLLTTDGGTKKALALSPNGAYIAYAQLGTSAQDPANSTVTDWNVRILDTRSNTTEVLQHAYAPQFFVKGGNLFVSYVTPTGMDIKNLSTRQISHASVLISGDIMHPTKISADGSMIAVYSGPGQVYILAPLTRDDQGVFSSNPAQFVHAPQGWLGFGTVGSFAAATVNGSSYIQFYTPDDPNAPAWTFKTTSPAVAVIQ